MKFNFFFDYIYYRIAKAYYKWDGRTGTTGIAAVTMIQMFLIIDIFALVSKFFFKPYVQQVSVVFILVIAIIFVFNYWKYNGSFNKFKGHWKNESEKRRIWKGLLIALSFFIPLIPLLLLTLLSK